MHIVLHFDTDIPAIISEPADGDLAGLQAKCVYEKLHWLCLDPRTLMPPALWIRIVAQLSSALDYMLCHSPYAHVDLKPGNILYQCRGGRTEPIELRCMIADYGICKPKDRGVNYYTNFQGTLCYCPPENDWPLWSERFEYLMSHLCVYQCAMTMLDLLFVYDVHNDRVQHPLRIRHFDGDKKEYEPVASVFRNYRDRQTYGSIVQQILVSIPDSAAAPAYLALHSLVRCATLLDYSPRQVMDTRETVHEQIKLAAALLNQGIPYYTTEPVLRASQNLRHVTQARAFRKRARAREHNLPYTWHASRPKELPSGDEDEE
jgi:hypothetical protein